MGRRINFGLLTFRGTYSCSGAAVVWRGPRKFPYGSKTKPALSAASFSRYTVVCPFYGPRPESRSKLCCK